MYYRYALYNFILFLNIKLQITTIYNLVSTNEHKFQVTQLKEIIQYR